jgi:hypothetical protein
MVRVRVSSSVGVRIRFKFKFIYFYGPGFELTDLHSPGSRSTTGAALPALSLSLYLHLE